MVLGIHHLESYLYYELFITPRVTPLYHHYSNELSICDAFDKTHVLYISDTLNIIRSVFKPQFIHYSKYAKYAFLLLFSILVSNKKNGIFMNLVSIAQAEQRLINCSIFAYTYQLFISIPIKC